MATIPVDAPRSPDGYYWWDGSQWNLITDSGDDASADPVPVEAPVHTSAVKFSTITLWFNVFIPDHQVSGGGHCFLGDDRSFDHSMGASSRLHAAVTVEGLGTANARMGATDVHCGLTRMVDCASGAVTESGTAHPSGGFANFHAGNTYADPEGGVHDTAGEHVAILSLDVAASDPLVPAAPSVGVDFLITIDPVAGTVSVNGVADHWPAFEGYASADGGGAVPLLQAWPPPGTDPYTLLSPRNAPVSAHVQVKWARSRAVRQQGRGTVVRGGGLAEGGVGVGLALVCDLFEHVGLALVPVGELMWGGVGTRLGADQQANLVHHGHRAPPVA